ATLIPSSRDNWNNWVALTPNGFFSAGSRDSDMIVLVRGLEGTSIRQMFQSLYNPDLVRMALSRDHGHRAEYDTAAKVIYLDKIVASGPPPDIEIISAVPANQFDTDLVAVTARIKDRGKGIGRIEWRANGVAVGVCHAPACLGPNNEVTRQLA